MFGHMVIHDVIVDVRIDDYEELEEVRQGLVRSLQDIERLLDGAAAGAVRLTVPDDLHVL
ncbi:hypothetical protein BH09PSE1_BH09PSE1_05710 [soil metagenome]